MRRLDPSVEHELIDVGPVEPDVSADLVERYSAFVDETAHEAHGDAERRGGLLDVDQWRGWLATLHGCVLRHRDYYARTCHAPCTDDAKACPSRERVRGRYMDRDVRAYRQRHRVERLTDAAPRGSSDGKKLPWESFGIFNSRAQPGRSRQRLWADVRGANLRMPGVRAAVADHRMFCRRCNCRKKPSVRLFDSVSLE